jgi:hypothetical protein
MPHSYEEIRGAVFDALLGRDPLRGVPSSFDHLLLARMQKMTWGGQ